MNAKLLQLLNDNRGVKGPRGLRVQASADEATVYIYDVIVDSAIEAEFWGGVAPEAFAKEIAAITAPTIHLRINSPGGSVFAARAMQAAIREHKATVVAHIDGYAASAASILMLAADRVVASSAGAMVMIHKAWVYTAGNADDLRASAELLDKVDATLVGDYAWKTGKSAEEITAAMAAETWFTAAEAKEYGLIDGIDEAPAPQDRLAWNLAALGGPVSQEKPQPDPEVAALLRKREFYDRVIPAAAARPL